MDKTSLGDRMKNYENVSRNYLVRRMPVIIRLDGKAFHTLTRKMEKPYDKDFKDIMLGVAEHLVENIMGCKLAYVQSDEISLLLTDYDKIETEAWFNNNIQKMVSVSASMATAKFNELFWDFPIEKKRVANDVGLFDSRAYNIPREEVVNYMIWRQQDATRNSIQGLCQATFGHKAMHGKNTSTVQDMLMLQKGINWNDVETYFKRGGVVYRGLKTERIINNIPAEDVTGEKVELKVPGLGYTRNHVIVDNDIPVFTKDRNYIECHVYSDDDRRFLKEFSLEDVKRHSRDLASDILERVDSDELPGGYESTHEGREMTSVASSILEDNDE